VQAEGAVAVVGWGSSTACSVVHTGIPFFSVIVPDYAGAVSETRREACLESLRRSSWRDFEVLWFHDGPAPAVVQKRLQSLCAQDSRFRFHCTPQRHNDWGHSLRDAGINKASGRYLLHLNADNVIYPEALATLQAYSQRQEKRLKGRGRNGSVVLHRINPQVLIYAIRLMGCVNAFGGAGHVRQPGKEIEQQLILPGWPPQPFMIDAMQLVTTREIWLALGGWHDKSETSDGRLLAAIARQHGYLVIPEVLGEHW